MWKEKTHKDVLPKTHPKKIVSKEEKSQGPKRPTFHGMTMK